VDPTVIPLGTSVELQGGTFTADDIGAKKVIQGYRIDVFKTGQAAKQYSNPISVGACTPATSSCPGKEIK